MFLLFGDSHTNIFYGQPSIIRFNNSELASDVVTVKRITDNTDTDLHSKLDSWLTRNISSSKILVIAAGEIDIRVHFWRHIPRNYTDQTVIENFVKDKADQYYSAIKSLADRHGLQRVVIWAPPAAGEKASPYNSAYPFTGPSSTRNRLVHLWHKFLSLAIKNDPRLSLASAFYTYVNTKTYETFPDYPSHDGTHWRDSCGNEFWNKFIVPAIEGKELVLGDTFKEMFEHRFQMAEGISDGQQKYDSWIKSLYVPINDSRKVSVNGIEYSWVPADDRHKLPKEYQELVLRNRQ